MNPKLRADVIKLAIFTAVAVLITVSVVATLLDVHLGQSSRAYHAMFTDATGLEPGDVVRIAGVEVGKITGVSLTADNQARVDFTVESSQPLTTTTKAEIEFENLLGQRYLAIVPSSQPGQPLRPGTTIPESLTVPGLDLTTVFSGFQPLLAALNPAQVNELTGSIIAVLQGESGAVANLVNQTAVLTSNLAQRQQVIYQVLDNLTPLLQSVNSRDAQLAELIDGLHAIVNGLAGEPQQLGGALSGLSSLTTNTSQLLNRLQPALDQDIGGLNGVTQELLQNQSQLSSVLGDLPALLNTLDKVAGQGSYLAIYLCDLTVNVSGPISVKLSPTVPQSPGLVVPEGLIGSPAYHSASCL
jgi:phospholipid/cholesterol/gamma-HCH transport system substrate-binding protein